MAALGACFACAGGCAPAARPGSLNKRRRSRRLGSCGRAAVRADQPLTGCGADDITCGVNLGPSGATEDVRRSVRARADASSSDARPLVVVAACPRSSSARTCLGHVVPLCDGHHRRPDRAEQPARQLQEAIGGAAPASWCRSSTRGTAVAARASRGLSRPTAAQLGQWTTRCRRGLAVAAADSADAARRRSEVAFGRSRVGVTPSLPRCCCRRGLGLRQLHTASTRRRWRTRRCRCGSACRATAARAAAVRHRAAARRRRRRTVAWSC